MKSKSKSKSKSAYGPAFFIRTGVLLFLLLVMGGALAYDRLVLVPGGEDAVDRVVNASTPDDAKRSAIIEAAGCEPSSSETIGEFRIDDWTFGRILPNLQGHKVTVIFYNDSERVVESIRGGMDEAERAALKK